MKRKLFLLSALVIIAALTVPVMMAAAQESVTITVTVVNNPEQRKLLELSDKFMAEHPNIKLSFVMLPENELRDRVTTDVTDQSRIVRYRADRHI